MERIFRIVRAGPHGFEVYIETWDDARDLSLLHSGPPERIYLQLSELDPQGDYDDLGLIELTVVGVWDRDAQTGLLDRRFWVEDPIYRLPRGNTRPLADAFQVRLPTSDHRGYRVNARGQLSGPRPSHPTYWEHWIQLRGESPVPNAPAAADRNYEVDFTFKRGQGGDPLSPVPAHPVVWARRYQQRRIAVVAPGGRAPPHTGCVIPTLRDHIGEFKRHSEVLRRGILDAHYCSLLCEFVIQLSGRGMADWWDDFRTFRSVQDVRVEAAKQRRAFASRTRSLETAAGRLLRQWRDAEPDLMTHHQPPERRALAKELLASGVIATETGQHWAIEADGAEPLSGHLWQVLGLADAVAIAGNEVGTVIQLLDELCPAWAQLPTMRLSNGISARLRPIVNVPGASAFRTVPGGWRSSSRTSVPGELAQLVQSRQLPEHLDVYQVDPQLSQLARGIGGLNALLQLAAWCMTMAELADQGAGVNRETADAVGSTIGLTGTLFEYGGMLLSARGGITQAASGAPWTNGFTGACSHISAWAGAGVYSWQAVENVAEDDNDTAAFLMLTAVGTLVMTVPTPATVVIGFVMTAVGTVGAALADDTELEQWALHGPYGRSVERTPDRAVFDIQLWCLRRSLASLVVGAADRASEGLLISLRGSRITPATVGTIRLSSPTARWSRELQIDLGRHQYPPGLTLTAHPATSNGRLEFTVLIADPPREWVGEPYDVHGRIELTSPDMPDAAGQPPIYHEQEFDYSYRAPIRDVPGGMSAPDGGVGGGA